MHFPSLSIGLLTLSSLPLALCAPFQYPLTSGFPNISDSLIETIQKKSGGHYGTYPPAKRFDYDDTISWGVLAFSELYEVAFFTQLLQNITDRVPGFVFADDTEYRYMVDSFTNLLYIEQLHYYDADWATYRLSGVRLTPCVYDFPVSTFEEAMEHAATMTWIYLAYFADMSQRTILNLGVDAAAIVFNLAGWSGEEGQQSGWFRSLTGKRPSAQPVLTPTSREFLYSWYFQNGIVEGTCNLTQLPLPVFEPLQATTREIGNGLVEFSFNVKDGQVFDARNKSVVLTNGNAAPLTMPLEVTSVQGNTVTVRSFFPYDDYYMDGLTIAAVVEGTGNFSFPMDVANYTLYGPGMILLN